MEANDQEANSPSYRRRCLIVLWIVTGCWICFDAFVLFDFMLPLLGLCFLFFLIQCDLQGK
jgi:hypothetical protein